MGCLKLTYDYQEQGEKNYSLDWHVWVNPESDFLGVVDQQTNGNGPLMAGGPPSYTPPPRDGLPGFPDAERVKPKGGRPRWRLPNGDIIEWDGQHRELERYNRNGHPKGVYTPEGQLKDKDNSGRKIDPFVGTPWYVPSEQTIKNVVTGGLIIGGAAIIIFDIITIPSGEGLIGVQMIGAGLGGR